MDNKQKNWAAIAQTDLAFMHDAINTAHPGVLDERDIDFHSWLEQGYRQAQALAAAARNERQARAAVRFFAVGFCDGHLTVWSDSAHQGRSAWAGWLMQEHDGGFFVSERADQWPVELPPLGAKILQCDGQDISEFIQTRIRPFVDRRAGLKKVSDKLAAHVTVEMPSEPLWSGSRAEECVADLPGGERKRFRMHWLQENEGLRRAFSVPSYVQEIRSIGPGRYWLHACDFQPDQLGMERLERLLEELRQLDGADMVVLDTRGNGGGNSAIGERILRALLKGDMPASPEQTKAWWRVSPIAVSTLRSHVDHFRRTEGEQGETFRVVSSLLDRLCAARDLGQDWLEEGPAEPVVVEYGPSFKGRLVLITDKHCASAGLDFADTVLCVPGVLHLGQPTSADTNYIDVTGLTLPSGMLMYLPLKVYRGRVRGSNQPLVPHFVFPGDINDTAALQAWTLDIMQSPGGQP